MQTLHVAFSLALGEHFPDFTSHETQPYPHLTSPSSQGVELTLTLTLTPGLVGVGGNSQCSSESLTRCTGPLQVLLVEIMVKW